PRRQLSTSPSAPRPAYRPRRCHPTVRLWRAVSPWPDARIAPRAPTGWHGTVDALRSGGSKHVRADRADHRPPCPPREGSTNDPQADRAAEQRAGDRSAGDLEDAAGGRLLRDWQSAGLSPNPRGPGRGDY